MISPVSNKSRVPVSSNTVLTNVKLRMYYSRGALQYHTTLVLSYNIDSSSSKLLRNLLFLRDSGLVGPISFVLLIIRVTYPGL